MDIKVEVEVEVEVAEIEGGNETVGITMGTGSKVCTAEGRRMSRAAEIMFTINALGEKNSKSGLREEGMRELR